MLYSELNYFLGFQLYGQKSLQGRRKGILGNTGMVTGHKPKMEYARIEQIEPQRQQIVEHSRIIEGESLDKFGALRRQTIDHRSVGSVAITEGMSTIHNQGEESNHLIRTMIKKSLLESQPLAGGTKTRKIVQSYSSTDGDNLVFLPLHMISLKDQTSSSGIIHKTTIRD